MPLPTGEQIRELRQALGLTQLQLARKLYLSGKEPDRHIRRLEANERNPSGPLVRAMEALAKEAKVKVPWK
jgi:transcriptional regulator with XRE-family HTH domain